MLASLFSCSEISFWRFFRYCSKSSATTLLKLRTLGEIGYLRYEGKSRYVVNGVGREFPGCSDFGWGSEFQRIADILEYPDLRKGKLLGANAYLIDSRALLSAALMKMLAEPYAFVTDISRWI